MQDTAYKTLTKALVELTDANPNEINNNKAVVVRDEHGKPKATFKSFKECLDIASGIDSLLEYVDAKETSTAYEITVK